MDDLLFGLGWFFALCGLAVLFNAGTIIEAWRDVQIRRLEHRERSGGDRA